MSYGFMVWAVDTNQLKQAVGSKDERLLCTIAERSRRILAQLDEIFEDSELSAYEALWQIIDGTIPPERVRGSLYAYAFECLVSHLALLSTTAQSCHGVGLTSSLWTGRLRP